MIFLIKLWTMATMLGWEHGSIEFYLKFPGSALGSDFGLIKNEADVMEMCKNVPGNRYIFVYISTIGVVIDENITSLVNKVDVDDNAVLDNEQHKYIVLENIAIDIEVNENENRPTCLDIVIF